jgi:flagellar hook-basal body complex protein FliE
MRINPYVVPLPLAEKEEKKASSPATFGELLQEALQKVNREQLEAGKSLQGLISGEAEDLHQLMIAAEKARLSLQLTVQLTNKVIEAYREITRMQI